MNFAIRIDPPAIFSTGAATDGSSVFGSLKMARAALSDAVDAAIERARIATAMQIDDLMRERDNRIATLRTGRKAALKVPETKIPSDETATAQAMAEIGRAGERRRQAGRSSMKPKKDAPHPIDIHVGGRVKRRRRDQGMSQTELADALGLTFQQVQKYERGANRISASKLYEIAMALNVPVAWFFRELPAPADTTMRAA